MVLRQHRFVAATCTRGNRVIPRVATSPTPPPCPPPRPASLSSISAALSSTHLGCKPRLLPIGYAEVAGAQVACRCDKVNREIVVFIKRGRAHLVRARVKVALHSREEHPCTLFHAPNLHKASHAIYDSPRICSCTCGPLRRRTWLASAACERTKAHDAVLAELQGRGEATSNGTGTGGYVRAILSRVDKSWTNTDAHLVRVGESERSGCDGGGGIRRRSVGGYQ